MIFSQKCLTFFTFLTNSFQDEFSTGLSFPHLLIWYQDCTSVQGLLDPPISKCHWLITRLFWCELRYESWLYKGLPFHQWTVQYWFFSWLERQSLGFLQSSHIHALTQSLQTITPDSQLTIKNINERTELWIIVHRFWHTTSASWFESCSLRRVKRNPTICCVLLK